jgi:YD repeat-containing protein
MAEDAKYHVEVAIYRIDETGEQIDSTANARILRSWVAGEANYIWLICGNGKGDFSGESSAMIPFPVSGCSGSSLPGLVIVDGLPLEAHRKHIAFARMHDGSEWSSWSRIAQTGVNISDDSDYFIRDLPMSQLRPSITAKVSSSKIMRVDATKDITVTATLSSANKVPLTSVYLNGIEMDKDKTNTIYTGKIKIEDSCQRLEVVAENKLGNLTHLVKVFHPTYKAGKVTDYTTDGVDFMSVESPEDSAGVKIWYQAIPYHLPKTTPIDKQRTVTASVVVAGAATKSIPLSEAGKVEYYGPSDIMPSDITVAGTNGILRPHDASCNFAYTKDTCVWLSKSLGVTTLRASQLLASTKTLSASVAEVDNVIVAKAGDYVDASVNVRGEMTARAPSAIAAGIHLIAPLKDSSLTQEPLEMPAVKNGDMLQAEAFSIAGLPKILLSPESHVHTGETPGSGSPAQQVSQNAEDDGIIYQIGISNQNDLCTDYDHVRRDDQDVDTVTLLDVELKELASCPDGRIPRRMISGKCVRLITQEYLSKDKLEEPQYKDQERHQILSGGYVSLALWDDSTVDPTDWLSEPNVSATVNGLIRTCEITKRRYLGDKPSMQAALTGTNPRVGAPGTHRVGGLTQPLQDGSVHVHNGELFQAAEDLLVKGTLLDFQFLRTHQSHSLFTSPVGRNWDFIGNTRLVEMLNGDVMLMDGHAGIETYKAQKNVSSTPDIKSLVDTFNFPQIDASSQYLSPAGDYRCLVRAKALNMPGLAVSVTEPNRFYLIDKNGLILTFVQDSRYQAPSGLALKTDLKGEPNEPPPGVRSQYLLVSIHHRVRARYLKLVRDAYGLVVGVIDDTPVFSAGHAGASGRVTRLNYNNASVSADRFLTDITDFAGRSIHLTHNTRALETVKGVMCKRSSENAATVAGTTINYGYDNSQPGRPLTDIGYDAKIFLVNTYKDSGQVDNQIVSNDFNIPTGVAATKLSLLNSVAKKSLTYKFDYPALNGNMTVGCCEDGCQHDYAVEAGENFYTITSHAVVVTASDGLFGTFTGSATTKYEYNSNGEITKIVGPEKSPDSTKPLSLDQFLPSETDKSIFQYDLSFGQLLTSTQKGITTTYGYDNSPFYLPTSIKAPYVETTITYDENGNPATSKDHGTVKASYTYNDDGLLIDSTDARGTTTRYGYYSSDKKDLVCGDAHYTAGHLAIAIRNLVNLSWLNKADASYIQTSWSSWGSSLGERKADANSARDHDIITTFKPNLFGDNEIVVDACGYEHNFTYNELSLLLKDDRGITHSYDSLDRLSTTAVPGVKGKNEGSSQPQLTTNYYDQLGNIVATESAKLATVAVYDMLGNPIASIDPAGYKSTFVYDSRGLLLQEVHDADGIAATSQYAYDINGNRILHSNPEDWYEGWKYNEYGLPTHHLSVTGLITEIQYGDGNLTKRQTQYEPRGLSKDRSAGWDKSTLQSLASGLGSNVPAQGTVLSSIEYEYNKSGQVVKESRLHDDEGHNSGAASLVTTTTWDVDGQPRQHNLPEDIKVTYQYNKLGQAISQTTASPLDASARAVTETQYDALGRPIIISQGHTDIHQTLDMFGQVIKARENVLNVDTLLAAEYDTSGNAIYKSTIRTDEICDYDSAGRLETKKVVNKGTTMGSCYSEHKWKYLSNGRLASTTATGSDGTSIAQDYSDYSFFGPKLTTLGGKQLEKVLEFDSAGNKTLWHDANDTKFIAEYDGAGNVTKLKAEKDGSPMHHRTILRDSAGRPIEIIERQTQHYQGAKVVQSYGSTPVTCEFKYDTLGHLVSETQTIDSVSREMQYEYTDSGHRSKTIYPSTHTRCIATNQYRSDGLRSDQLDSGLTIEYDNDPVYGTKKVTANGSAIPDSKVNLVSNIGYDPADSQIYAFNTMGTPARLATQMSGGIDGILPELSIKTDLNRPDGAVHPLQYIRSYRRAWGLDDNSLRYTDRMRTIGVNINSYNPQAKMDKPAQRDMTKRETTVVTNSLKIDGGLSNEETAKKTSKQAAGALEIDSVNVWGGSSSDVSTQTTISRHNALGTLRGKSQASTEYGSSSMPTKQDDLTNALTLDARQLPEAITAKHNSATLATTFTRERNGLIYKEPLVAVEHNVFGQPVVLRDLADTRNSQCTLTYDGLGRLVTKNRGVLYGQDQDVSDFTVIDVGRIENKFSRSAKSVQEAVAMMESHPGSSRKWILRIGEGVGLIILDRLMEYDLEGCQIIIEGSSASKPEIYLLSISDVTAPITIRNLKIPRTTLSAATNITFDRCDIWTLEASNCSGTSLYIKNSVLHDEEYSTGRKNVQTAAITLTDMSNSAAVFTHNIFDLKGDHPIDCKWTKDLNLSFSTLLAYNNTTINDHGKDCGQFISVYGKGPMDVFNSNAVANFNIRRAAVGGYDSDNALATCDNLCRKFADRGTADCPTWVTKQYGRTMLDRNGRIRHHKHPTPGPVETTAAPAYYRYVYDGKELTQRETWNADGKCTEITRIVQSIPSRPSSTFFIDSDGTIDVNVIDRLGKQVCLYRAYEGKHKYKIDGMRNLGILQPLHLAAGPYLDYLPYYMRVMEGDFLLGRQGVLGWDQIPRDWSVKLAGPMPEMDPGLSPITLWLANLSDTEVNVYGTVAAVGIGIGLAVAPGTVITGLAIAGGGGGVKTWAHASRENGGQSWWAMDYTNSRIADVVGDTMIAGGLAMSMAPAAGFVAGLIPGAGIAMTGYGLYAMGQQSADIVANWGSMDTIDKFGSILPTLATLAGGFAARGAMGKGYTSGMKARISTAVKVLRPSQTLLNYVVKKDPALWGVRLRTKPVFDPNETVCGRATIGDLRSTIGPRAFANRNELLDTVIHEEAHIRDFMAGYGRNPAAVRPILRLQTESIEERWAADVASRFLQTR